MKEFWMKPFPILVLILVVGILVLLAWATESWPFDVGVPAQLPQTTEKGGTTRDASMDDIIPVMHEARKLVTSIKDYRCLFLRDEVLKSGMKNSQMRLKVRHEPFSVHIEYIKPDKGRRAFYHQKEGKLHTTAWPFPLDPNGDLAKSQSRNSIADAGMLHAIQRFCQRWDDEKKLGRTEVQVQNDVKLELKIDGEDTPREFLCTKVTTIHDPRYRDEFETIKIQFYRTIVFFDKKTGFPFHMKGYGWPTEQSPDGDLEEGFTYLDVETNVGLTDQDFTLKK
jgi:hypothetical protein